MDKLKKIVNSTPFWRYFLVMKLQGLIYKIDNTNVVDPQKNGELYFIKQLANVYKNKPFVFFDVGANVGKYTDFIFDNFSASEKLTGHLFEPQLSCFGTLQAKYGHDKRVVLNNYGLASESARVFLHKDNDGSGLASLSKRNLSYYNATMDITEEVVIKKSQEYIVDHNIDRINLLKLDVEGHEIDVLRGFDDFIQESSVDFIQFEYGGANLDSHTSLLELFGYFEKRNFIVCKIMPQSIEERKYHPKFENFMYQNYVAVSKLFIADVHK